jgi:hypothetical protein
MTALPSNPWTRGLGLVALVLVLAVVALAWRDRRLSQRVVDLETRLAELETSAQRSSARRDATAGPRRRAIALSAPLAVDSEELAHSLAAPEARQMIEDVVEDYSVAEREERRQRREEYIDDWIHEFADDFAADQGLDDDAAQQMLQVLLEGTAARQELRVAMMDGELDSETVREERDRVVAEMDERLVELLGEETFDAMQVEMEKRKFGAR